jgi:5-formaminoimidazole-4-carboxamide-1-beta-D-ribofuranosyl 5'-monophosphate synthetase
MKHLKVAKLNQLITTNQNEFRAGCVLSEKRLCELASLDIPKTYKSPKEVQQFALKKMSFYVTLNKLLAKRGLYITAKDYYTEFKILPKTKVQGKVKNLDHRSKNYTTSARVLAQGERLYHSTWKPLTPDEEMEVSSRVQQVTL